MSKSTLLFILFVLIIASFAATVGWERYVMVKPTIEQKVYRIGLLQMAPVVSQNMDGFKIGMRELGYEEGVNISYVYRDAQGDLEALEKYAKELTAMRPDMIFVNTSPATQAIKNATANTTIPVVFSMVADPLGAGFVKSVESSGNNLTGTSCAYIEIAPKRLEVLTEAAPNAKKILVFYRPEDKSAGPCTEKIVLKAQELDVEIIKYEISKKEDIENYLKRLKEGDVDAIMDPGDSMVSSAVDVIIEHSLRLNIPYMALSKGEVEKGAQIGYAVDYVDLGKQSALIANQVLSGVNPANIPFELPRRWMFALNLKSAGQIGLEIPDSVIQKADFVIK